MKNRKVVDRWLTELQISLEAGDLSSISEKLSVGITPYILTRLRERKLIVRTPLGLRDEVVVLLKSAGACLPTLERANFNRYLDFSLTVDASRIKSLEALNIKVRQIPSCSLPDILAMAQVHLDGCITSLMNQAEVGAESGTVANRERSLHDLNGALNDIASALARVVNEWSKTSAGLSEKRLSTARIKRASTIIGDATKLAGDVNSLEWLFDCVSFGDFVVEECLATPLLTFRLQFSDPRRHLIRTLAIRRELVLKLTKRRARRLVRELLQRVEKDAIQHAVDYYKYVSRLGQVSDIDFAPVKSQSEALLMLIDAEDDLLLGASKFSLDVQAYYFASMTLNWFALGARVIEVATDTSSADLIAPAIPLDDISESIDDGADGKWVRKALDNVTTVLPTRSHQTLISNPFIRDGDKLARTFLGGHTGIWNLAVREALIQGGAIGKSVGSIWEDFYAELFKESSWKIVGRGVKLKSDGRLVTDVDLLLLRDDLLLVVQIKALIGSGLTIYDHWKNRQTIEFGCSQGRSAANFFDQDPESLVSICGRRAAIGIKHIQPVVLTNSDHYNGWSCEGVPVIGEVTRKAICTGSKVDYFDGNDGKIVHTHHFTKQEDLTTDAILTLLRNPIELDISAESTAVNHASILVGNCSILLPRFIDREDRDGAFGHEPSRRTSPPPDKV